MEVHTNYARLYFSIISLYLSEFSSLTSSTKYGTLNVAFGRPEHDIGTWFVHKIKWKLFLNITTASKFVSGLAAHKRLGDDPMTTYHLVPFRRCAAGLKHWPL